MVREFIYHGETFRATVHGHPGKEEIFIVQILADGDEGAEISIDRFEDKDNDPTQSLDGALAALTDKLIAQQDLDLAEPGAPFRWSETKSTVFVHSGIQH